MKRLLLGAVLVLVGTGVHAQTVEGEERLFPRERLEALSYGSVGPSPQMVVPLGSYALSIDGDFDLGGFVFKDGLPFIHNDGGAAYRNTAVGLNALVSTTPGSPSFFSGRFNSAFGYAALQNNVDGTYNTASGSRALYSNATGSSNTAIGRGALFDNTGGHLNTASGIMALYNNETGYSNTASGSRALFSNTTGDENTAMGRKALFKNTEGQQNIAGGAFALSNNTTGSYNTAIGDRAGLNWTTGDNNIAVGQGAQGVADESDTIRIGGDDIQTQTFIEGIRGASSTYAFDEAVCTNSQDQLGPCAVSSLRFKQDVEAMGDTTEAVGALHPVTFRYKPKGGQQPEQPLQYGLIAEEVAKVLPTLVSYDDDGKPYTVRYSLLTPLLLNELQKQHRWNEEQAMEIRRMTARLDRLEATESP